ncbi:membrane protein YfhO [Lachnoanaerobaculum sp. MSX33]|uniref:YfhO family protein n=1 Tax=Lachnoanaerobaculum sp. MSX33 TaxID=936596 RepID=UPI0003DF848F|nr:YfhO family protein [Lachnoanaerobaculum sp. MSX33]ETO94624.1 membrane protein YfhO [Lachnoanaerobaculum sp. MSX33]
MNDLNLNQRDEIIMDKRAIFALSFLIPVFIMILIFIQRGIFPFGDESFLRTDMYHQYAPFFSEFKYKLSNGGSLLYSWDLGMGINFSALYAYYLASPLNWLIILCPQKYVIEFMTYMIVAKIGLSGLGFTYYLSKHTSGNKAGILFFGIFYALSGYMAAYSWNIMWLDCIILFPIVCLGIERLVKTGKGLLYTLILGLCILSNYYISIMICLFMVIYFISLNVMDNENNWRKFVIASIRFAVYSVLAGGLSALVLLPEIYALKLTASGDFDFPSTFNSYFSIFDMIARHMGNVKVEIGLDHWPNIFCGVGIFLFVVLYILNRKISKKEKAVYISLLVFFLAGFSINVLNYIWHGLHYPNSLPARQSFIYIFLVLFICAKAYDNFSANTTKDLGFAFGISMIYILLAQKIVNNEDFHFAVFYAAMIFISIYAMLMYLHMAKRISKTYLFLISLAIVVIESSVNMSVTSVTTINRSNYINDNADVRALLKKLPMDDFYRIDKVDRKTKDDGAWLNFKSVSIFSSTANALLTELFEKLGNEASTNAYSITGETPLLDMLFAVKYAIYTGESRNTNISYVDISGNSYLYENPYTLPLGYMVDERFTDDWNLNLGDPIDVQNDLAAVYGLPDIFEQIETIKESTSVNFQTDIDGEYYAYVTNPAIDEVEFSYGDGDVKKSFKNLKRHYILELGTLEGEKNGRFVSTDDKDESIDARVYRVNYDSLKKLYYILNKNPLYLSKISDSYLSGNVHAVENTTLFTSIPYDEGWSVYVDGKKAEKIKIMDAFIGLKLEKGQHEIEFKYLSSGIIEGAIISAASLTLLLLICLVKKVIEYGGFKFKKKEVIEDDEFEELDIEDSDDDEDNDEDDDDEEDDDESEEKNGENKRVYVDITTGGGKGVVELLTKNYNPETDENTNNEDLK